MFKAETTGFPDGQEVECARKRGLKNDFKVFGLSKQKDEVAINWHGKDGKKNMFEVVMGVEEFSFVLVDFEMDVRYQSGDVEYAVIYLSLEVWIFPACMVFKDMKLDEITKGGSIDKEDEELSSGTLQH